MGAININSRLKIILDEVACKLGFHVAALVVDNEAGSGYTGNVQLNPSMPNDVAHNVQGKLSSEQLKLLVLLCTMLQLNPMSSSWWLLLDILPFDFPWIQSASCFNHALEALIKILRSFISPETCFGSCFFLKRLDL